MPLYCRLPAVPRHLRSAHQPFRATLSLLIRASAPKHYVGCKPVQTPLQIPPRFLRLQYERSIFDNERRVKPRPLHPPFTILGRRRPPLSSRAKRPPPVIPSEATPCHPERSERSERSRGISPFRRLAAPPVIPSAAPPPVIPSEANAVSGAEGSRSYVPVAVTGEISPLRGLRPLRSK